MGKGALITAVAVVFSTLLMLFNSQVHSNETDARENSKRSQDIAKDLAMLGRKLVLTSWIQNSGAGGGSPFNGDTLTRGGGKIWIEPTSWSNPGNDTLGFRVMASYDSTVHEVRSMYAWKGFALNALQMKAGAINPTISSLATINVDNIALDDQSLQDLEDVLVDDLELVNDLSVYGLGLAESHAALSSALTAHPNVNILDVTQAERDVYDAQEGLFYPDQISQAIEEFALANPLLHQAQSNAGSLGATFGIGDGMAMLTIEGDMTLSGDLSGKGILVVEGDLVVPAGVSFNWEGVILVKPPQTDMSPTIDLSGTVSIEGALVALHEGLPNTGHMDLSVYRDMTGGWTSTYGQDFHSSEVLMHTHDYSGSYGNRVVFHSDDISEPNNELQTYFNETLSEITTTNPGDSVYFEIYNSAAHGLGVIKLDETTGTPVLQTVNAGFDASIRQPGNPFRTVPITITELEHFDITVTRISSLKKMWDSDETDYDPCNYPSYQNSGPECIWSLHDRYGALTLRMYQGSTNKRVYEANLYWHRRTDEEEDFENEMNQLASAIQDPNYGLDFNLGDDVYIQADENALLQLGAFSGFATNFGVTNLGTWHRQWAPDDAGNPLYTLPTN